MVTQSLTLLTAIIDSRGPQVVCLDGSQQAAIASLESEASQPQLSSAPLSGDEHAPR
jgi:hypothetical protein